MELLTIIYSSNIENLLEFKSKATHWLPEQMEITEDIYQPPNIICTTKRMILEFIQTAIQANTINYSNVIWIKADNPNIAYLFDEKGYINNFFRLS